MQLVGSSVSLRRCEEVAAVATAALPCRATAVQNIPTHPSRHTTIITRCVRVTGESCWVWSVCCLWSPLRCGRWKEPVVRCCDGPLSPQPVFPLQAAPAQPGLLEHPLCHLLARASNQSQSVCSSSTKVFFG